jgi:hypothetical protein
MQELFDAKVTEYESRIAGLQELLDKSSEQIQSLERQQPREVKVTESEGWGSEEIELNDTEVTIQ